MNTPSILRLFSNKLLRCGEFKSTINGAPYYEIKGVVRVMCRKERDSSKKGTWRFVLYQANLKSANHGKVIHKDMSFEGALAYVKVMMKNSYYWSYSEELNIYQLGQESAKEEDLNMKNVVELMIDNIMEDYTIKSFDEIDSLTMMDLIMVIEDGFDVSIPLNVVENLSSKDDFLERILKELG
jgi:acyl carrier protein